MIKLPCLFYKALLKTTHRISTCDIMHLHDAHNTLGPVSITNNRVPCVVVNEASHHYASETSIIVFRQENRTPDEGSVALYSTGSLNFPDVKVAKFPVSKSKLPAFVENHLKFELGKLLDMNVAFMLSYSLTQSSCRGSLFWILHASFQYQARLN